MKKLSSQVAAMLPSFQNLNAQQALHEKFKADCVNDFGFVGTHLNHKASFLSAAQLAEAFGVSLRTLERARTDGSGPPFIKVGRQIRYPITKLDAWVKTNLSGTHQDDAK